MKNKNDLVLELQEIDNTMIGLVGGKAANLGELIKMDAVEVPKGFCLTTNVYKRIIHNNTELKSLLREIEFFEVKDREKIREASALIRVLIENLPVPDDIVDEIARRIASLGEKDAYAIRSSATAEDLPTASFAGQQESYLNIAGVDSILLHISKCFASLFTERAILYRIQNGFDHRKVYLSVIVQKMIFPEAAGIMFTADPVTSNRKITSIDASFGLGESLVSGLVNPDVYKLRNGKLIDKKISAKKMAVYSSEQGGTIRQEIAATKQNIQTLTDEQVLWLEQMGRKIEAHFGQPQDIEWCLAHNIFYIVQSRPITTLFPIPGANDQENRVYVSVGHQQMMTDPIKPLGLSFFLLTTHATMRTAGGRLFVDVTPMLSSPDGPKKVLDIFGKSDPLIKDALHSVVERNDFIKTQPPGNAASHTNTKASHPIDFNTLNDFDPAIVFDLVKEGQEAILQLQQNIQSKSGLALFDFIFEDIQQLKKSLSDPQSLGVIVTAMNAAAWLNEKMEEWLDEKKVADTISQSVPNNITSEMGLTILDLADRIRPYPALVNYLQQATEDHFLDEMTNLEGGREIRDAIKNFLQKYGMRCAGEIDITRTRWAEKPSLILPLLISSIKNQVPGASKRKFEQGLQDALRKEQDLLSRVKELPGGEQKAKDTKRMIDLVRNLSGYREYPKYSMVSRYFLYKLALLKEAEQLLGAGLIRQKEDIYYLGFDELREVVRTGKLDYQIIIHRKEEYKWFEKINPPRVITSDGEIVSGKYKHKNLPPNAIAGLAVSSGIIEGRARVILNMEEAKLEPGDILVTSFTDPSWTPLFLSVKALVTEVGGLMTHGAVIAREYGLPAVVGVENATKLISDGQQIRVNGTEGYVELI
jgi:pyruvate,water dikinase